MNPKILEMMRFRPSGHNQVSLDHIECISEFLEEFCPIDKQKAKKMLRGSMGISSRYIQEYIDSFEAWKIIKIKSGNIEYLLSEKDKPLFLGEDEKPITMIHEAMRNETTMLPCKYRPEIGECNPVPGINIIPNPKYCNECSQRVE